MTIRFVSMSTQEKEHYYNEAWQRFHQQIKRSYGESLAPLIENQTQRAVSSQQTPPSSQEHIYAIEIDNKPCGFIWFLIREEHGIRTCHVIDIFIEEEFRGQGIAKQALQQLTTMSRDLGAKAITLTVFEDNIHAKNLYQHMGFDTTSHSMLKLIEDEA